MVEQFTLESPHQHPSKHNFRGKVIRCDREHIYVEIFKEKDVSILKMYCKTQLFDICFKNNRLPYQVQHKTLDLVLELNLHSLLIANKNYDRSPDLDELDHVDHSSKFRGKLSVGLNSEQKLVVNSILKMDTSLPYLLFGPAGICVNLYV